MFYEKIEEILDSKESNGWSLTARRMNLTVDQLRRKIHKKSLTMEEGLSLVRASESPELLAWVLGQVRPEVMNGIQRPN